MQSDKKSGEEDTLKSDDSTNGAEEKIKQDLSDKLDSLNEIAEAEGNINEGR